MKSILARMASILALIAVISAAAYGSASAVTITGTLKFDGGSTNFYDPANGFVPAGFGNSVSPQLVPVGTGIEFGFDDTFSFITADFTFNSLVIKDVISLGDAALPWTQTFTANTPGFFNGLKKSITDTDTFAGGVTYSVLGDMLILNWVGTEESGIGTVTSTVTFEFDGVAPVPLPAALPLFATILAAGGLIAWRRKRKAAAAALRA